MSGLHLPHNIYLKLVLCFTPKSETSASSVSCKLGPTLFSGLGSFVVTVKFSLMSLVSVLWGVRQQVCCFLQVNAARRWMFAMWEENQDWHSR